MINERDDFKCLQSFDSCTLRIKNAISNTEVNKDNYRNLQTVGQTTALYGGNVKPDN